MLIVNNYFIKILVKVEILVKIEIFVNVEFCGRNRNLHTCPNFGKNRILRNFVKIEIFINVEILVVKCIFYGNSKFDRKKFEWQAKS